MTDRAAEIARGLSRSEAICIQCGITWSGAQRNKLIGMGLVAPYARGAPCLPKHSYETPRWELPLTPLGLAVREYLQGNPHDD